jgi:hypothetical protein
MPSTATATRTDAAAEQAAADDVEKRLKALRKLAKSDPSAAQVQTWEWLKVLGKAHDERTLNALFELGKPPKGIDGQTEGMLVTFTLNGPVDRGIRALTGRWMPWLGKRFNAGSARGDNLLAGSARWPAKLLWPRYRTKDHERGRAAFDFETAVEPSKSASKIDALKIDYGPIESNPRLLIRKIRDELVEVVPGAHLGKMLWRTDGEPYPCLAYFALRQPAAK